MRALILCLALGAVACVETPRQVEQRAGAEARERAELDRELAGLVAGPPQTCIDSVDRQDLKTFGSTLVYRGSGSTRYVTQAPGCNGVGRDDVLVTRSPTSQLCRGDIATTVDRYNHFPTGSCSFGDFVPYRRAR